MLMSQLARTRPRVPVVHADPISTAKRFVGLRYVWGGTSPWGFDCSGLTWYAFRAAGVVIPRDADAQFAAGKVVSLEDARPGDLVFYGVKKVHHVALYLGKGRMIESPDSAHAVRIVPLRTRDFAGVRRFSLSR
jgi:cell wall-associated NlpC family hydrolase